MWLFRPTVSGTVSSAARSRARLTDGGRSMRNGSGPVWAVLLENDCIGMCSVASCPRAAPAATCSGRSGANGNHDSVSGAGSASTCSVYGWMTPMSSTTTAIFGRASLNVTGTALRRHVGTTTGVGGGSRYASGCRGATAWRGRRWPEAGRWRRSGRRERCDAAGQAGGTARSFGTLACLRNWRAVIGAPQQDVLRPCRERLVAIALHSDTVAHARVRASSFRPLHHRAALSDVIGAGGPVAPHG